MKKMMSLLMASAVLFTAANAQEVQKQTETKKEWKGKEGHKGEMKHKAKEAFDKVGLSADQQQKALATMKTTKEKIKEIKQSEGTKDEKKSKIKDLRTASSKELEGIMGKEKFEAWKKEMKESKKEDEEGK